jgi:hypothetical protein
MSSKLTNFLRKTKFQNFSSFINNIFSKNKTQVDQGKDKPDKDSEPKKWNNDENIGKEFNRGLHDDTDKTKPYDNYEAMIYHPELREQMEKRKDMFHTLDTPYVVKEKEQKEKENREKDINMTNKNNHK